MNSSTGMTTQGRLLHHNRLMSTTASPAVLAKVSWFPLAIVMMCQIQVSFNAFNVSIEGIGIILGVDRFLDMCRTTLNVSGDLAAAVVVSRGEVRPVLVAVAPPAAPAP